MKIQLMLAALLVAGCANSEAPDTADTGQFSASEQEGSVVGHLVLRDYTVTITLVRDGRRYTVATNDGQVLATDVDIEHLAAHFPAVHELFEEPVAGGIGIWAGL